MDVATIAEFTHIWEVANSSKKQLLSSRKKGKGLWGQQYQESAVLVSGLLKNFSPVLEIIKTFTGPYGNIAMGVISVLLVVCFTKAI